MTWKIANRLAGGLALALFIALGFVACKGSGTYTAELEGFNIRCHINGTFSTNPQGQTEMRIDSTRNNVRVDVEFRDAQGSLTGGAKGVGVGQSVVVPNTTTTITISGASGASACTGCTQPPSPPSGGSGPGLEEPGDTLMAQGVSSAYAETKGEPTWLYVYPLRPILNGGPLRNAYAQFDFPTGIPSRDMWSLIEPILMSDADQLPPVPRGVEVGFIARAVPHLDGSTSVYVADTSKIRAFSFTLNGTTLATETSNSVLHVQPFDWYVMETMFWPTAVNPFGQNDFAVLVETADDGLQGFAAGLSFY